MPDRPSQLSRGTWCGLVEPGHVACQAPGARLHVAQSQVALTFKGLGLFRVRVNPNPNFQHSQLTVRVTVCSSGHARKS